MNTNLQKDWPDIILPTPKTKDAFQKIFGNVARVDLNEYEAVFEGCGARVWKLYKNECEHRGLSF